MNWTQVLYSSSAREPETQEGSVNLWHAVEIQILVLSPVVDWDVIQVGGEALGYVVAQA